MDFITSIIKRPLSISSSGAAASSRNTTTAVLAEQMEKLPPRAQSPLIAMAMNQSINTELTDLLDSAALDLVRLDQQHSNLVDDVDAPAAASEQQAIDQLLSEINLHLSEVSANEMEHLQAKSEELSPLALKPSHTSKLLSMGPEKTHAEERQLMPGTPTEFLAAGEPAQTGLRSSFDRKGQLDEGLSNEDTLPAVMRFTGLPEFDETQIPELAPLSVDMEAQLKAEIGSSNTILPIKMGDTDYNSDSDVFVECLSVSSDKYLNDPSELETYRSALNEAVECQLSISSVGTLENTSGNATAANDLSAPHNCSYEPMDVDDINETMEMLKDVLEPEDHMLLRQQILSEALQVPVEQKPLNANADLLDDPKTSVAAEPPTEEESKQSHEQSNTLASSEESTKSHEQSNTLASSALLTAHSPIGEVPLPNSPIVSTAPLPVVSPPIPTHRPKTVAALDLMTLKDLPLPQETANEEEEPTVPTSPDAHITPLTLDMTNSLGSAGRESAPASPTFPFKVNADKSSHFPRSPNAPPDREQMAYLERGVIEPAAERKLSMGGAIAKLPVTIQITQPSPEKGAQQEQLNHTMSMSASTQIASPTQTEFLNGTFDTGALTEPEHIGGVVLHLADSSSASPQDSGVPLSAATGEQRRTFSIANTTANRDTFTLPGAQQEEQHSRRTYSLHDDQETDQYARRTFSLAASEEQLDPPLSPATHTTPSPTAVAGEPRRTFSIAAPMPSTQSSCDASSVCPQRTFSLPAPERSPTLAAEQAPADADFEPMDVDMSLRSPPPSIKEPSVSPPLPAQLKRQPIHGAALEEQPPLSAKEQATASAGDEKDDVFVEHFGALSPVTDDLFKAPQYTSSCFASLVASAKATGSGSAAATANEEQFVDAASNSNLILNSSDFEYLYTKGLNNAPVDRSSLLLKFDPLLGAPVPVNPQQHTFLNVLSAVGNNNNNNNNNTLRALSPTIEEHESNSNNQSFVIGQSASAKVAKEFEFKPPVDRTKKHAKMSVDVIGNDCNKTYDNSNLSTEDKANNYNNMDELEKKIKNEVTKSEDIEKKLKEAEQREEALIKRITEKDKTNAKLNGVIEAYEKAIAELINEKEQLVQNYESQLHEIQTDRDSNYHHLTSLETTFSDLHVKYEKSKEMTSQLKQIEETLLTEKKQTMENLRLQEQRYEKMKSHAMQQLEIANKKLDTITKEHADEVKKLKALLKKEEVSRVSIAEQLQQKSRENADLVKICEELIYGKGQGGSS